MQASIGYQARTKGCGPLVAVGITVMAVTRSADQAPRLVVVNQPRGSESTRISEIALAFSILVALWFIYTVAFSYLTADIERLGIYRPRYNWLLPHIVAGTAALLLGPAALWAGLIRGYTILHAVLFTGYVLSIALSTGSAFYLAWKADFSWVFGTGFFVLAPAWTTTTGFAAIALCLRVMSQYREWMIRSTVMTFAFVIFRILVEAFGMAKLGTLTEQMTAASWLCWSVPLLITESVLQARKIFTSRTK